MAFPQFVKIGLTTLVMSRGPLFPVGLREVHNQIRLRTDNRTVRVAVLGDIEKYLDLQWVRLPPVDYNAIGAWVRDPLIDGSAGVFTYIDTRSMSYSVRWWNDNYTQQSAESNYNLYDLSMTLRVEL